MVHVDMYAIYHIRSAMHSVDMVLCMWRPSLSMPVGMGIMGDSTEEIKKRNNCRCFPVPANVSFLECLMLNCPGSSNAFAW